MSELQVRYRSSIDLSKRASKAPLTLEWNHAMMIRAHSIRAAVREIINANQSRDLVRVNVVGESSTGKSTLSDTIGHLVHTMAAPIPYTIRRFNREELLDFENTLSTLTPTNHVMIFDDVSWLKANAETKKLDKIQKEFTEVRHLKGGKDIKIILILNFHYSYAIPKPLRQAAFFAFTNVGSNEKENLEKTFGKKWLPKVTEFERVDSETLMHKGTEEDPKMFSYPLGGRNKPFVYNYKAPFAPALWWNRRSLRHIVFPRRQWIDPVCALCSGPVEKNDVNIVDLVKLKEDMLRQSGNEYVTAIRVKLFQLGINAFSGPVQRAMRIFDEYMKNKTINPETLLQAFDMKIVNTRLAKAPVIDGKPTLRNHHKKKESSVQPSDNNVTQ